MTNKRRRSTYDDKTIGVHSGNIGSSSILLHSHAHPNPPVIHMVQVGDVLPEGTLLELSPPSDDGACVLAPQSHNVRELAAGKRIVIIGVPGAFTPTCSQQHLPGFIQQIDELRASGGVDEVWCMAVNDCFVMQAWGAQQGATGKVRMLADGSAVFSRALGVDLDLTARGMGVRCKRFAGVVDDGVVRVWNVEAPGKFDVSNVGTIAAALAELPARA